MSKQIRNLGAFLMVCYVALFLQLNRFAFFDTGDVVEDPRNRREILRDFGAPRGSIVTQDNQLVAFSEETDSEFQLQRVYPEETAELYSHVTGYFSIGIGSTGLENSYNDELAGRTLGFDLESVTDYFFNDERVGNLTLTLRHDVQTQARDLLNGQNGSVVVMNPQTGAIYGMYSNPTYDPNQLTVHDYEEATNVHNLLNEAEGKPLRGRTFQERFFPGSTFKVVTSAAGLGSGNVTPDQPVYPSEQSYTPPRSTRPITNYGNNTCGGALFDILARSCNTSFMRMAVENVGAEEMTDTAEAFGFNAEVPIDLPGAAQSFFPQPSEFEFNEPVLALSAIGQGDVTTTPLEMALVASAVANDGEMPTPHVVAQVRDDDDRLAKQNEPDSWRTAMEPEVAGVLREAMVNVAENGTATNLREGLDGYVVGGKTGTAQLDSSRSRSHAWIIGFAGPPDEVPEVAVAVLVEAQEGASEQTGGTVAAPIAAQVMGTALAASAQPET